MEHRPKYKIQNYKTSIKLLEDNIRENLDGLRYGDDVLYTPKA